MLKRHKLSLADDHNLDVLASAMLDAGALADESRLYDDSALAKVNSYIRAIDGLRGSAHRLQKFAGSDENKKLRAILSRFFFIDPDFVPGQKTTPVWDSEDGPEHTTLATFEPEWLTTSPSANAEFDRWTQGVAAFEQALEAARRELELQTQHVALRTDSMIGGTFPELYEQLYPGAPKGGGDDKKGPLYTFVAKVTHLTMGRKVTGWAINQAMRRYRQTQKMTKGTGSQSLSEGTPDSKMSM